MDSTFQGWSATLATGVRLVIARLVLIFVLRWYLAYRPGEVSRVYKLLEHAANGCLGHGPAYLLVESAAEIGFVWSPEMVGWVREGLPVLSNLADPVQHFQEALLEGWRGKVSADLCARKGFLGGPW